MDEVETSKCLDFAPRRVGDEKQPLRAGVYGRQSRGMAKAITDQIAECTDDANAQGWAVVGVYSDGSSASRYAKRKRDEWAKVLAAIEAVELDVLVLWESSRGDLDLPTWAGLLATCRKRNVLIRVTSHGRTYDMSNARDGRTLAEDGVDSAYESEKTGLRIKRGVAAAAAAGRPPMGPCPYGYRRIYDPATGRLTGQEPDPDTAPIAAEIITQVARGVPVSTIAIDLNSKGIPAPGGGAWRRLRVRTIALSPAYIGKRRHGDRLHDALWPALVDEPTWYAAGRVLTDPQRMANGRHSRPGRQKHLMTYIAECHQGHPLQAYKTYYQCAKGCVGTRRDVLDDLVRDALVARLSKPDAYAALRAGEADANEQVAHGRADVARLEAELDGWRRSAAAGQTSPESLAVIEAELVRRIRDAQRRVDQAATPAVLRQFLDPGGDVRARWDAAPVQARRELVRMLLTVKVRPIGRNPYVPPWQRVDIKWKTTE